MAQQQGVLCVYPLRYTKTRIVDACFEAARRGLLCKERKSCGYYRFYPVKLVADRLEGKSV